MTFMVDKSIWDDDVYRARDIIKPGDYVVDLGAYVGEFAIWAAKQGAKVTAYEPLLENYMELLKNIEASGTDIKTYMRAAGQGKYTIHKPDGVLSGTYVEFGKGKDQAVDLKELTKTDIDFLKVDIEGAEYELFKNAGPELKRIKHFTIEYHVWRLPTDPVNVSVGIHNLPMPKNAARQLLETLRRTHNVEVTGDLEAGGGMFGVLK